MKRYWIDTTIAPAIVSNDGRFIEYSDHKAAIAEKDRKAQEAVDILQERIKELEAELAKMKEERDTLKAENLVALSGRYTVH